MKNLTVMAILLAVIFPAAAARGDDFAIRDGDTVVFLGDSITAERSYGKLIENYTLLRYPQRRVKFINAGWGGDTAAGGLKRLDRDVFSQGVTLLTVAYGVNDIGWGTKADDEHRQLYLDSIRGIVEACRKRGVRVYICSAAITAGDRGEDDYLQKMCNDGMAISRSLGEGSIDVMGGMRKIQNRVREWNAAHKEAPDSLHTPDGVHLSPLGAQAMGFVILKGLGAPAHVSSVTLAAEGPKLISAAGCQVSDLEGSGGRFAFTRLDEGLPLNLEPLWQLQFRFIPFPEELNRYMLTVKGLAPGEYEIRAAGRLVGTWDASQLEAGLNLASATPDGWIPGGPWDAQAHLLKRYTEARGQLALNAVWTPEYTRENPNASQIQEDLLALDAAVRKAQQNLARPVPYRFIIERARPKSEPTPKG